MRTNCTVSIIDITRINYAISRMKFFEKFRADNRVANAGFVLETDEHHSFGRPGALTANDIARDADDPNMVYIVFAITDMEKAKARMESPELKKLMTDAGVDSEPKFVKYTLMN